MYDMDVPSVRKGIAGWKLTKRPIGPHYENGNQSMIIDGTSKD